MSVGELCNRQVVFISKDNTVAEAAQLMRKHHVGALVVTEYREGRPAPVGVLTDRDIVIEVVAEELNLEKLLVGDVMSFDLTTVGEDCGISEALKLMRDRGIRRVPVVRENNELVGIFAIDDMVDLLAEELSDISKLIAREEAKEKEMRR